MKIIVVLLSVSLLGWVNSASAQIQRVLGLDISAWQGSISQTTWNNIHNAENRQFIILRSSRGGTTGYYDQNNSDNNPPTNTESQRYDDPYYVQNINRVVSAGMFAGSYHFSRPDIIASTLNSLGIPNNGTDEADHFIQMAGPWMRPGYLVPVHDFEAGDGARTDSEMAQFCIDFSNRIYERMGIRPAIYINGNYAANILGGASQALRNQLAQPPPNLPTNISPSVVSPCYPYLWSARWPNQTDPNSIDVQNTEPKDTYSAIYGPWDDYGVTHPWKFWQYASTMRLNSFNAGGSNLDADAARGGTEFLKDQLVPAVWMFDGNGDWGTLTNWNSGQTPVQPVQGPGQVARVGSLVMPTPRLPGVAGTNTTTGLHDTVILERPNANITLTVSTGTYNIRKLYMRETLNIVGGSLTVNFAPSADSTTNGAQFSGSVTLSNSASFSVHTLQVDTNRTLTLAGGTLTLNTINLMPGATPAKILMNGDVAFNSLSNVTAIITNGSGAGSSGLIDLGGGTRAFNVGNGSSEVDLSINVPIINGALTKTGVGTMRLSGNNTFAGNVTINGGTLRYGHASGLATTAIVTVNNGGVLDMNGISDSVSALASAAGQTTGVVTQGSAGLTLVAASGTNTYSGRVNGSGTFTKNGASIQILNGNNSFGSVVLNTGSLVLNGNNTTAGVTVNSGGTLGGIGTISGAVTINSGGAVSPGASIGTLTLNSAPAFNGTTFMDVDANGGSPVADKIVLTSGTLNYSGTLVVSNVGAALLGGETFTLFSAPAYSGAFANSNLPPLSADLNWFTGALAIDGTIKVNRKPATSTLVFSNTAPSVLEIPFNALIANATDADGDALVVAGVNLTTTNGIALTTNATMITYSNNATVNDQFSYIIADGKGGSVTGTVNIVNIGLTPSAEFAAAPVWSGNSVYLQFSGVPGGTYFLERSTNLPPTWVTIWTNVAPPIGVFDYTDNFSDLPNAPESAFYRLSWPP